MCQCSPTHQSVQIILYWEQAHLACISDTLLFQSKMDFEKTSLIVALIAVLSLVAVLAADDSCPPKICKDIKVSCITCNGTMLFLDGPNCGCCPQCVPFRGEGEPCDVTEEIPLADSKNETSMKELAKANESAGKKKQEKKEKKAPNICSPELTCLQGTCVAIF